MRTHKYRTTDVAVDGGTLHAGVWEPVETIEGAEVPTALLIHGITASHLAWPFVVAQLPDHRVIAPDLRGRGGSHAVAGRSSMRAHAADMQALLDACGAESAAVVGHSMGAFVAVVLADTAPDRVTRLVLVDGGLPFDVPAMPDLEPEEVVNAILGPTAERLSKRFADVEEYLAFWRAHPAFQESWSREVEQYFAYDLVPVGSSLRPATSLETTIEDMLDLNTGSTLTDALARVAGPHAVRDAGQPSVLFYTVPRGLQNEVPGLYPPGYVEGLLAQHPVLEHHRFEELNHYSVVMTERGAAVLGGPLREAITERPAAVG
ncbi:alpha/beta fold hydrolase [Brevibacterium yomogidense]|uniref:Putative hydrolase n=1 Tax=Brevibacterium yomogidense TaxID=946573 RepID=A0A1X6X741_9MICO|nr:alpha/beta hydrolase [Brevibacterium yomogidense]SLM95005.1 putative hydrolase [Brevibacterium yomogidense]